jgi:hypothetical protein
MMGSYMGRTASYGGCCWVPVDMSWLKEIGFWTLSIVQIFNRLIRTMDKVQKPISLIQQPSSESLWVDLPTINRCYGSKDTAGKFGLCSVIDRALFLLRLYGPSSGRASVAVLQSLYHTRTNLYFYLIKFDTDYKDVYLRIGDCVKSPSWQFWGWSKSAFWRMTSIALHEYSTEKT